MYILGIESSCDETAASIVKDGRQIVSNIVYSQVEEHGLYGGVVPEIASRRHIDAISEVVQKCFDDAHLTVNDLDAIACTYAPGLIGALLVGVSRVAAAEFTFFLAVPVMFGLSFLKLLKFGFVFTSAELIILLIGCVTAFVVSLFVISFLMGYIKKKDFKLFGWYRIILGVIVIAYFALIG